MNHEALRQLAIAGGLALIGLLAGVFTAALAAFSRSRLEEMLRERNEQLHGSLRRIVEQDEVVALGASLWHSLAMGMFLVYVSVTWIAPVITDGVHLQDLAARLLALLALTGFLRVTARLVGEGAPERLLRAGAVSAYVFLLPLLPLARLFLAARTVIARGLGHEVGRNGNELEEEVMAAVSDGVLDDVVKEEQKEMIEGIFNLKDADVADILTPRTDMVSIDAGSTLAEAVAVALEKGHSRLPVHEENRDNIIGIFYVRDALRYWDQPPDRRPELRDSLRTPVFVPETKRISELLHEMQRDKVHLCVVLDEYGGTAGLVTIEDVLEEIVGEIEDEYDQGEAQEGIRRLGKDTIEVAGQTHVHEVNEALDENLLPEDDDYETVGGFVLDELGHIPKPGESFAYKDLMIEVLDADERKVNRVQVRRRRECGEEAE